jgi:hypothetical protein
MGKLQVRGIRTLIKRPKVLGSKPVSGLQHIYVSACVCVNVHMCVQGLQWFSHFIFYNVPLGSQT